MKRTPLTVIVLLLALAFAGLAGAQSYGATVDAAWYDSIAKTHQNPPAEADRYNIWSINWPSASEPIRLNRSVDGAGNASYQPANPNANSAHCVLYSNAGLALRHVRAHASRLGNLTSGPGADEFKAFILQYGDLDIIGFDTSRNYAAVVADGIRYPPLDPSTLPISPNRVALDSVEYFSIAQLRQAGAIKNDQITIVTGLAPDDRCVFNLTQLR